MIVPPFRLLVLNVPPDCAGDVQRRLAVDGGQYAVQAEVHAEGAELGAASEGADIAVIDGRSDAADAFRLLADVRHRIPRIPIVLAPGRARDAARPTTTTVGDGLFLIDVSVEDDAFLQRITEAVAFPPGEDRTCGNWTSSGEGSAMGFGRSRAAADSGVADALPEPTEVAVPAGTGSGTRRASCSPARISSQAATIQSRRCSSSLSRC